MFSNQLYRMFRILAKKGNNFGFCFISVNLKSRLFLILNDPKIIFCVTRNFILLWSGVLLHWLSWVQHSGLPSSVLAYCFASSSLAFGYSIQFSASLCGGIKRSTFRSVQKTVRQMDTHMTLFPKLLHIGIIIIL